MPGLFPIFQPQLEVTAAAPLPLCREVDWDFAEGKPVFERGRPVTVTGAAAVRVWCWKALMTQRARYDIYSWAFGSEVETLIGQDYSGELKAAEAARYVRECLEPSPYITDVSHIQVGFDGGRLAISARVHTIYGEVRVHV